MLANTMSLVDKLAAVCSSLTISLSCCCWSEQQLQLSAGCVNSTCCSLSASRPQRSAASAGLKVQGGSGRVCHQRLPRPPPHHLYERISPDFYVSHGPHWAAQGGSGPLDPPGQLRRCMASALTGYVKNICYISIL